MSRFQYKKQSNKTFGFLPSIGVFLAVILLFLGGLSSLSDSTLRRQKESLENAITRSVTYCYAVEGSYPENLDYLKDNYGLIYDEDTFFVDYRVMGANILPDITIIEKGD